MKKLILSVLISSTVCMATAQSKQDTVVVSLAKTSKVTFTMKDRSDLEILKHYNFQALFQDILLKIEKGDTTKLPGNDTTKTNDVVVENHHEDWGDNDNNNDNDNDNDNDWDHHNKHHGNTRQSFNIDLGMNNYLSNGKFPDSENAQYSVRPWGSWSVALNSIQRTRLANKFFLEWGGGISWYNFKFQDDDTKIVKTDIETTFIPDTRAIDPAFDFTKSKLTVCYLQASVVPVIDFSDKNKKTRIWDGHGDAFRVGLGPYIGYRIDSYSKQVYEENGDKEKEHNHDSFYLQNVKYGLRLQLGYRGTDLFFNYDLNNLFVTNKGPNLNAFSFGITL